MKGLSAEQFTEVLTDPKFGSRLVEVTLYTGDYDAEAGFVVYRKQTGLEISPVTHADTDYLEAVEDAETHPRFTPPEKLGYMTSVLQDSEEPSAYMPQVDLGRLITLDGNKLRTDLAIVAHTHPLTHRGRRAKLPDIRRLLMPSASDLLNFAEHAAANPGLIAATAAAHTELGGIALFPWRVGEPDCLQRIAQQVEPPTPERPIVTEINEAKMAALGLRFTTIAFNRSTGAPLRGMGTIHTSLFA